MTRFRTRQFTPRPERIETAQERGLALRNWLDLHRQSVKAFAAAAGLPRSTLNDYLSGKTDIASLDQTRAGRIIEAMGITDWDAWEVLGIPEEARGRFRTFRPHPLGHGQPISEIIETRLDQALIGEISLPSGTLLRIAPSGEGDGPYIVKLEDGRLYSVGQVMLARAGGTVLGRLVSAHF